MILQGTQMLYNNACEISACSRNLGLLVKGKGKVKGTPCTSTEALYRPYGL